MAIGLFESVPRCRLARRRARRQKTVSVKSVFPASNQPGFSRADQSGALRAAFRPARARAEKADAILVSQVVTQRGIHKDNSAQLVEMLREKGLRDRFILLLGGPRIDHKTALELGFDAGFGPGTLPSDVANFLYRTLTVRS